MRERRGFERQLLHTLEIRILLQAGGCIDVFLENYLSRHVRIYSKKNI